MEDLIIGSHVSFKKDQQLLGSVIETLNYGANTFMFYTGAPQNTNRASIDQELTHLAWKLMEEKNINKDNVIVHAPYIINLANNNENYDFAVRFLKEEISRCEKLGIKKIVLHPGSHVGVGIDIGIENIIRALNIAIDSKTDAIICLETMAGKGSEVGSNFYEIKRIIDGVKYKEKVMVCIDTCHLNDAGYNIEEFDNILKEFDKIIGLNKLACIHINDSKNSIASHKDRHENFGLGSIGFNNLINVIYHPLLKGIPKILETPYVTEIDNSKDKIYPPYKFEIEMIKQKKLNQNLIEDIRNFYK